MHAGGGEGVSEMGAREEGECEKGGQRRARRAGARACARTFFALLPNAVLVLTSNSSAAADPQRERSGGSEGTPWGSFTSSSSSSSS